MNPGEWREIEELFHRAIAQPPELRAAWVKRVCGGDLERESSLLQMIAADASGDDEIMESVAEVAGHWLHDHEPAPEKVGAWRILHQIGQGGMGSVYLAARDDSAYQKRVAIKLLKRGIQSTGTRERFLMERQILSGLDHPNIARMLDGGSVPDGRPYLVMEYVDGKPFLEHCWTIPLRDRIRLLVSLCEAVAYAHQRLIVHRDLKPANILVDTHGSPKLLDFGIAKLLGDSLPVSSHTQALFTADYASPEQLQGKAVTTATDVYALGSILFQLITGRPAHLLRGGGFAELVAAVCERDVDRPSRVSTERVPEDLDNVVLRAMAREPERRYPTAHEFAEDLRRFLDNRPIRARGDSWTYVAGKFVRRHMIPATVIAGLVLSLAGSAVWSWTAAREANRQRARADERSQRLRGLTHQLLFDVQASLDGVFGATKARQMLVKTALEHFELMSREGPADPSLHRDLAVAYRRIGDVQGFHRAPNLGDLPGAIKSYQRALDISDGLPRDFQWRLDRMLALARLADALGVAGKTAEADARFSEAVAIAPPETAIVEQRRQRVLTLAEVQYARAQFLATQSQLDRALEALVEMRRVLGAALKESPDDLAIQGLLAGGAAHEIHVYKRLDRIEEAYKAARFALPLTESVYARNPTGREAQRLINVRTLYGDVLSDTQSPHYSLEEALEHTRAAAQLAEQLLQAEPGNPRGQYNAIVIRSREGRILRKLKRTEEAVRTYRAVVTRAEELAKLQPDNATIIAQYGAIQNQLAFSLQQADHSAEALRWYTASIATLRPVVQRYRQTAYSTLLESYLNAGGIMAKQGRTSEAAAAYRAGLEAFDLGKSTASAEDRKTESQLRAALAKVSRE